MLNVALRGRLLRDMRPELFPLRLPLSVAARASFAVAGLRIKRDAEAYMREIAPRPGDTDAAIRLRALQHGGDRTFADFLGRVHPDAMRIFEALTNRSIADPDEISQSAMAALFGHVWDSGDLGRNMRGGSGLLPDALGRDPEVAAPFAGQKPCLVEVPAGQFGGRVERLGTCQPVQFRFNHLERERPELDQLAAGGDGRQQAFAFG